MHRDHPQAGVEQAIDEQPVRALERDQLDGEADQPRAQRVDPALGVSVAATLDDPPIESLTRTACSSLAQSTPANIAPPSIDLVFMPARRYRGERSLAAL